MKNFVDIIQQLVEIIAHRKNQLELFQTVFFEDIIQCLIQNSDHLNNLISLMGNEIFQEKIFLTHSNHFDDLLQWEDNGLPVFEGLSNTRIQEWHQISNTLKYLRYATKLFDKFVSEETNTDLNASIFFHSSSNHSAWHVLWLLSLVRKRNQIKVANPITICAFSSIDHSWLGYREESDHNDAWVELTIDFTGTEWVLNPVRGKQIDLSSSIDFQNNIFISNISSAGQDRPPPLDDISFVVTHLHKVLLSVYLQSETCLVSATPLHVALSAISLSSQSSFPPLLEGIFSVITGGEQGGEQLSSDTATFISRLQTSISIQPMNFLARYLLARVHFIVGDRLVGRFHLDKLIGQLEAAQEQGQVAEGDDYAHPAVARETAEMAAALHASCCVEGGALPGDRVEVIWRVTASDGTETDEYYAGTVQLQPDNGLNIRYDDPSDRDVLHRVEFVDCDTLINMVEDCEMQWRLETAQPAAPDQPSPSPEQHSKRPRLE